MAACTAIVLLPNQIEVTSLSQTVMPVVAAGGKLALAFVIIGIVAATFGAALETTLSGGYILAQFLGWPWGSFAARWRPPTSTCDVRRDRHRSRCAVHRSRPDLGDGVLGGVLGIALPLTSLPILIVANDSGYMGDETNGRVTNVLASIYLVIVLVASLAVIPLMIVEGSDNEAPQ